MLLHEFREYLEEAIILFEKLEYIEEQGETNDRMHELYNKFRGILLLEVVTDNIQKLQYFLENFGDEIKDYYHEKYQR
jgi:hypothetical protein